MADARADETRNGLVRCMFCGHRTAPSDIVRDCEKREELEKIPGNAKCYFVWDRWIEAFKGNVPIADIPASGRATVNQHAEFINQLD